MRGGDVDRIIGGLQHHVLSEFGVVFSGLSESCKNLQVTETCCGVVAKFRMQFSVLRHSPSSS